MEFWVNPSNKPERQCGTANYGVQRLDEHGIPLEQRIGVTPLDKTKLNLIEDNT
jgi:hypothetical protein